MVSVVEVRSRRQRKEFVEFPLRLFKGNDCFVPPLYGDEMKIFRKDYVYADICDSVYYLALRDGKTVGRIAGIVQRSSNEIRKEKRVRFDRFDSIDDTEVSRALLKAVEDWGKSRGMDTMVGPLGFSDLEREGLLVEGFDQLMTFEEQYHADYYQRLIEDYGMVTEVEWNESKIMLPDQEDPSLEKMARFVMDRYHLKIGEAKNTEDFLRRYADGFFELLDKSYAHIYGTVPFTEGMKKNMIDNFRLIIDVKHVAVLLDENDRIVCLGLTFPSIARAVQKSGGRLTPACLVRLLRAIRHPKVLDLGLVGVDPEYLNRGVTAVICHELMKMLKNDGLLYAETNLNLIDNAPIQNMWKRFKRVIHKRRKAYIKKIAEENQ